MLLNKIKFYYFYYKYFDLVHKMVSVSKRLSNIKPSPTIAASMKAAELRAGGLDVIGLGAGEPDFDTPDHIKIAAQNAINEGKTKYTAVDGIKELKQAIIDKFKRDNNILYNLNEISVGTGGKQILYNALMSTIDSNDEVIIPAPYWVSYPDMVLLAEGKPVIVECGLENNFKISAELLSSSITDKSKWLILNSPSNPTGNGYTRKDLEDIALVLKKHDNIMIMMDDMYEYLVYDNFQFATLAEIEPSLKNRILTCNGVSKSFCMTGWRIGYAGGPEWLIKAMSKIQSQSTSNPNSIAQWAAVEALNGDLKFLEHNLISFKKRRDFMVQGLNNISGLKCSIPDGAFYLFPSCEGLIGKKTPKGEVIETDQDYTNYLLEEALVAVVPGSAFGLSPFFRISYATSDENLEKSLIRIDKATNMLI